MMKKHKLQLNGGWGILLDGREKDNTRTKKYPMEQSCPIAPHICMEKPLKKVYTSQTVNKINGPKVSLLQLSKFLIIPSASILQ